MWQRADGPTRPGKVDRDAMRPLKLHTKTTILISAITVAVMLATVLLISVRIGALVREDEKELARLQSLSLAEQISLMPSPRDDRDLTRAVAQARGARPNVIAVRVWARAGDAFTEYLASVGSPPAAPVPAGAGEALRRGLTFRSADLRPGRAAPVGGDAVYRVFAPITEKGRVSGAVEIDESLDNVPSVVWQYAQNAFWLALVAVAMITLATWLSFRYFVYHPLERLLRAISPAGEARAGAEDELGRASQEYHRMLGRVQELTEERGRQQEALRERIREATRELQSRNTQLAEANRELWETSRRLTQMERLAAAGQTAAQFAHEVGTPLNTISIHVELLRAALDSDPGAATRTGIIAEQVERIERIVRRMLDRTRAEKAVLRPLDLRAALGRVCDTMGPTAEARGVRLAKSFGGHPLPIAGDADRLQQVLINLINNALDAMPGGGELRLAATAEGGQAVVEVADTGCGMSRETRARIFDPLYTTKERGRGTGLGLVVVRQIVEEHGGSIAVESEPGRGSRFVLRFPAAARPDAGEAGSAPRARPAPTESR